MDVSNGVWMFRRHLVLVLFVVFSGIVTALSYAGDKDGKSPATPSKTAAVEGEGLIVRGSALGDVPVVKLADVIKDPGAFVDQPVIFEGLVGDVCQTKGCWMTVSPGADEPAVRVTFKDYGFFVPKDSGGALVRAQGRFHVKVWSKEDADHMEGEGAKMTRNEDGSATELGFVADGVELRRSGEPSKPVKAKSHVE